MTSRRSSGVRPRFVLYVALLAVGSLVAIALSSIDAVRLLEPLRTAVQAELSAALGADVSFGRLSLGAHGLVLDNLLVHAGVAAGAGLQSLSVRRAYLDVAWWRLPQHADGVLEGIVLDGVEAVVAVPAPAASSDAALGAPVGTGPSGVSRAMERLLATRLARCRVSNLSVAMAEGPGDKPARLFDGELNCERKGGELVLELAAKAVVPGATDVWSVQARATADPTKLQLDALRLTAPGGIASARGALHWKSAPAELALTGDVELRSDSLADALAALAAPVPELPAVRAERALAAFEVHGPVRDAARWLGRARVALAGPVVQLPGARAALELDSLYFEVERHAGGLRLDSIVADAPDLRGRAQLDLPDTGPRVLSGSIVATDFAPLFRALPDLAGVRRLQPRLHGRGSATLTGDARWTDQDWSLEGELDATSLALHGVGAGDFVASHLGTRFAYRSSQPSRLDLSHIALQWPDGVVRGSGRIDLVRGRGGIEGEAHHFDLEVARLDARALTPVLAGSIERGTLRGSVTLDGDAADPIARLTATARATDILWRPPTAWRADALGGGLAAVALGRAFARVSHEEGAWRVDDLVLDGSLELPTLGRASAAWVGAKIRGRGALGPRSHQLVLDVERLDARVLSLVLPGSIDHGVLSGSLALSGSADDPVRQLASNIRLSGGDWSPPRELVRLSRVGVGSASADLLYAAGEWQLSHVRVESTEGELSGSSAWSHGGHHTSATFVPAAHGLLATLVPGHLDGGATQIEASVRGTPDNPLEEVRGVLRLRGGRWTPPPEAELCTPSLQIREASANYAWSAGGLRFDHIRVETDALGATGTASWSASGGWFDGELTTREAGRVFDAFPSLSGLFEEGEGAAHLHVETSSAGTSGVVEGHVSHGRLAVRSASADRPTKHPVDAASFTYEFGPKEQRIRALSIRGPELNLDLDAAWSDGGSVTGGGQLWLTPEYTSEVTEGADLALWLLGYPRIETDFTLSGTDSDVRMDATIAHGWRWRLLRVAVPERLEKIGRAEMPVYTAEAGSTVACAP